MVASDDAGDGDAVGSGDTPDSGDIPASGDTPAVVSVGAATVDRTYPVTNLPAADGGAYAPAVEESFGGVGANVAFACARLDRSAGLIARLGDDEVGARVAENLAALPVNDARIRRRDGTSTHCVILRDGDGKRSIVTAGESARRLRLDDADRGYLADADAAFLTAYNPDSVHREALDIADRAEAPPFVFDLSGPLAELSGRGAREETVDRWVESAALFVVGEVAAESYLGCTGGEAAETLRERGASRVAVTSGEDGAVLADADGLYDLPAFDVSVVDETGAGDAYVAALVDRWILADAPAREAGRFAAAAGALNVTENGARGGLATRTEIESFLANR
ncbi:carbohydrate kinase family protein [Halobaculum sp. CBA1158]|uniref:carbohydrate kinase family protein n=1 Tax=Halobaculum sp. CBA1158 TaxID=2904243 RepID=UPI001F282A9E|nr:carbohydrate kinase family protein [Halobaculum sp. CBA1158]UIO98871.1 carbohydrate kinase family protein [Halobaculum sp. CBA1158]